MKFFEFLLIDADFQVQVLRIIDFFHLILAVLAWVGKRVKSEHIHDILHFEVYSKFLKSVPEAVDCYPAIGLAKTLKKVVYFVLLDNLIAYVVLLPVSRLWFCWLLLLSHPMFAHRSAFQSLQWHFFIYLRIVLVIATILYLLSFLPSEGCDRRIISKDIIIIRRILPIIPFAPSFSHLIFLSNWPQLFLQYMLADPPKLFKMFFFSGHRLSLYSLPWRHASPSSIQMRE